MLKGIHHLSRAANLILHPKLRPFVLVPLLINLLLFVAISALLVQQFGHAMDWMMNWLPEWLSFLSWLVWILFAGLILVVYGYCFSLITNIIAAPFYGMLAEKAEELITGKRPDGEPLKQMIPRTFKREMTKLGYFIPRGLGIFIVCLLLSFIPLVGPIIAFIWGAWTMAIQYVDYPADNHQLAFGELRRRLGEKRMTSLSLGSLVMLGTMVPIVNIVVMPIAVVAGTYFWSEQLTLVRHNS